MVQKYYYLSEISVSSKHGGGLTLQRILQDDLGQFDNFFHVDEFATRDYRIIDRLKSKEINLHKLWSVAEIKVGSLRYYRDRLIGKLRLEAYFESGLDKRVRKATNFILRKIDIAHSSWLVVPQNLMSVLIMNRLIRAHPVKYITWVMDDHVIQWNHGWHYPDWFESEMASHLQNARKVFVISPAMARLYRNRFHVESEVLFGPADPIDRPLYEPPNLFGPVRLGYFGAVGISQRATLCELAKHLSSLDATLDLFTFHEPPPSLLVDRVRFHPPVPADEVMPRMREYDGVIIVVSFEERFRNNTGLNILTKLSECLASGTVTVIIGPDYSAMVQFARDHGGALIVTDLTNPSHLMGIKSLKATAFRERYIAQSLNISQGVSSVAAMRKVWAKHWPQVGEPSSCRGYCNSRAVIQKKKSAFLEAQTLADSQNPDEPSIGWDD